MPGNTNAMIVTAKAVMTTIENSGTATRFAISVYGVKLFEDGPRMLPSGKYEYNYLPVFTSLCDLCADRVRKGDKISVVGDFETVVVGNAPASQPGFLIKASAVEFLTPRKTMGEAVAAFMGGFAGEDAA